MRSVEENFWLTFPYSLVSLVDIDSRPISDFYRNIIVPLTFMGFGSAESIMNLKMWEIHELKYIANESETWDFFCKTHGLISQ